MKIVSVSSKINNCHIPLNGWESVVTAVNIFANGHTAGSQATTDHQTDAITQSQGALGLGLYLLTAPHMQGCENQFVDHLLAEAHNALKSREQWKRSYDYNGQGVFFKTSVEIGFLNREEEMYYLSIYAAYVGYKPEEGLAEALGIPRALTGTSVVVEVEPTSKTTFAFDFDKILYLLKDVIDVDELSGKNIVSSWNFKTRRKHDDSPSTVLFRNGEIEVILLPGRVENRWKWANGDATNTWQFDGAVLSGLLDESYQNGKDYDEPTFVISVRRHSKERFGRKPFYLPEEKETVLALSKSIADALA